MGMRVEPVWAPPEERGPTFESIRYFRPLDEPDAPFESYVRISERAVASAGDRRLLRDPAGLADA